ncbi:MAG: helix-turn-helix domain-containing protein [Rhodobacter sp.]|jgi:transcriptional regulator with XRE-family HTH domain|nr:helix-turn-helix domain-containing protein [Rhodobacter sp.]
MPEFSLAEFGKLVRARRTEKGLSQEALAAAALGNPDRKGYISQLENGKLPNITALTLQKIARALDIPQADIDSLLGVTQPPAQEVTEELATLRHERGTLQNALDNLGQLTRAYLIALATQFELPDAYTLPDPALRSFLTKKAEEYRAYRIQIDALDERIAGLGNLKAAAQDAAERLDFDQVEALLSRVHEVETDIAAKTAEARAANALLRGQVDQAYRLLSAAADSFAGIDPVEPARRRNGYQDRLYSHGLRYSGPSLALSARMTQDALADLPQATEPTLWASLQNNLAVALQQQGSRTGGAAGAALLGQAVDAFRAALEVHTRADHPVDWAMTTQNLASALQDQGSRTGGAAGAALLGQAVDAYRKALEVRTRADHPVDWAQTTQNLAGALQHQGIRTEGAAGAALLGQAVDAYRAALEVRTRADHPVHWAMTTQNLARALQNQGSRTEGAAGAAMLGQAAEAYRAALEVRTRADHPVQWAMTQENMALLEQARAAHDTCTDPAPHLRAALDHVTAALTVFDPDHMPYNHGTATRLRDALLAQLAAL